MLSRSRAAALRALLPVALLIPLAACAGSPGAGEDKAAGDSAAAPGFPYTLTNCGVSSTFQAPPQRAVTMNQHATELLLALGLGDRIAGSAYLDDAVLPVYRPAYDKIKVLAEEYPSKEVLLGADPDFVYGGYASAFDKGQGRDREGLAASGINSRLNVEYCTEGKVGLDQLKTEITEVARTFGVPERGAKLVEEEQRRIDAVTARVGTGPGRPSSSTTPARPPPRPPAATASATRSSRSPAAPTSSPTSRTPSATCRGSRSSSAGPRSSSSTTTAAPPSRPRSSAC